MRRRGQGRFDLGGELGGIHQTGAPRVVDHVLVVLGPQKRVDGHRDDAGLDGAPEGIEERRTVLDHHQHAFTAADAETGEGVPGAIDVFSQLRVGHLAGGVAEGDLVAAAFVEMAVDEGNRNVEVGGIGDARRPRRTVDLDRVVAHGVSSPSFVRALARCSRAFAGGPLPLCHPISQIGHTRSPAAGC